MSIHELLIEFKDKNVNSLVKSLMKRPKLETGLEMPKNQVFEPNRYQQADLLFMPDDNGYKYILTVADVHNKHIDAEALQDKEPKTVIKGLKKIYSRPQLDFPDVLQTDAGTEFKGAVNDYLKENQVWHKTAQAGRHRQQAIVEKANGKLAKYLFIRQTEQELKTGEPSTEWVDDLGDVVKYINTSAPKPITKPIRNDVILTKYNKDIIPMGAKVRILLDNPKGALGEKLHGTFRITDIRWDKTPRTITNIIFSDGFPPLYVVDDNNRVTYTRNQIQEIPEIEREPVDKYSRVATKRKEEKEKAEEQPTAQREEVVRDNKSGYSLRQRATRVVFK